LDNCSLSAKHRFSDSLFSSEGERQSPLEGQDSIPERFWKPMVFKVELTKKLP